MKFEGFKINILLTKSDIVIFHPLRLSETAKKWDKKGRSTTKNWNFPKIFYIWHIYMATHQKKL